MTKDRAVIAAENTINSSFWEYTFVLLFGRRSTIQSHGVPVTIATYRGNDYLLGME